MNRVMNFLMLGLMCLSTSAFAFNCKYGNKNKSMEINETGNYIQNEDGYVYMVKYNSKDQSISLSIEGGPEKLNTTHTSARASKSYLSLGHKGSGPDTDISCDN